MDITVRQFTTIDISDLPENARKEILYFYTFLRTKYVSKKDKKKDNKKTLFLQSIEKHRYHLPDDYSFNRELANER